LEKIIKKNFLVVSDYGWLPDNLEESWVVKYTDNYLIYDRKHRWEESDRIKHQKNVGQNVYDMFDFIITHYDNLPDVTIFCRACLFFPKDQIYPKSSGNCSEEKFIELINNETFTEIHNYGKETEGGASRITDDGGYLEINNSWYFGPLPNVDGSQYQLERKYFSDYNEFMRDVYVNPIIQQWIRFSPGCNYIIPKSNILRYSKNFYDKIREYLSWAPDMRIAEAHMIERALYTIFTCDWEVNEKYK